MSFSRSIYTVWLRYFAVFRKNFWYGVITTFMEPLLYLASFGFGLGSVIGELNVDGGIVGYRAFVLAGLIGQTVLFQSFFEAAYGGFVRMYYQKVFQAIAVTPITLSEVLWGELLWCSTRATVSASVIFIIGVAIGDFRPEGAIGLLPLIFLGSLMFASLGMLVAGWSKTIEAISYPQYLLIFPMFLFCGVFYPITNLPEWIQWPAQVLPLTPLLSLTRALVLDFRFEYWTVPLLLGWTCALVPLARKKMRSRLLA